MNICQVIVIICIEWEERCFAIVCISMIPKTIDFILLNIKLNINAWFIWFGNLVGIYTQSGYNPYRMCQGIVDLASVAWESQFVNPQGGKIPISWHKKLVETSAFFLVETHETHRDFSSRFSSSNLVEMLIIIHHLIYCMSIWI